MNGKSCSCCGIFLPLTHFSPSRLGKHKVRSNCRVCAKAKSQAQRRENPEAYQAWRMKYYAKNRKRCMRRSVQWNKANPARALIIQARRRAKRRGIEFSLVTVVIPEVCPVLGIPLRVGDRKVTPGSPTLDRIDPSKGYTPGNTIVVSHLANSVKYLANPSQIRKVADFYAAQFRRLGIPEDLDLSESLYKPHAVEPDTVLPEPNPDA